MTRIILINGSPRKYGAVSKLLAIAAEGVKDAGANPEIIHLIDYDIRECMGCVSDKQEACRFPCIIKDDFNMIGKRILESEGFIIGTPIYWYSVSGRLKNFIDRLTSMENMIVIAGRSLLEGKIAGFIASGNDSGSIMAIAHLMVVMNSMGVLIPPWALAYHHTMEDVLEDEQAVMDSYNVGYIVSKAARTGISSKEWYKILDKDRLEELRKIAEKYASQYASQREERYKYYEEAGIK